VQEVREATDYQIPIQLKLGAARVYDDVRMAAKCGPDIIYLDGPKRHRRGSTHCNRGDRHPTAGAIPEARRALEKSGWKTRSTSSSRAHPHGGDIAKCLALGAKGRRDRSLRADGSQLQQGRSPA